MHQVSDDSDGVHKCDHTRGVDTKQSDDGIDHTFVSAGESETICRSFLLSFVSLDVYTGEPIPKYNGQAPTGWLMLLWEATRGATAEA